MSWVRRRWEVIERDLLTERLSSLAVRRLALLCAIALVLAFEKLPFTAHAVGTLPDGGYYMNIASHVRDGDGFISDLSLAHKGAPTLPYPTDMYPLWPLVYGHLARWFPIEPLGHWLPAVLYFAAIGFAYLWGAALFPRPLFPRAFPGFSAGHVCMLMLGLNSEFYRYTSYPYTEGLTFALLFAGLWRIHGRLSEPSLASGLEIGVWLGLVTLCRKQMFFLVPATVLTLLLATLAAAEHRKRYVQALIGTAVAVVAVCAPDWYFKSTLFPDMSFARFLRWDQNQHTTVLSPLRMIRGAPSPWAYLTDRAAGLPVAFGRGRMSYAGLFYTFQYALPLAIPLALSVAWRRRRTLVRDAWVTLWTPEHVPTSHATLVALGGFSLIHTMHMYTDASWEWMFAGRHALSSLPLFFLALAALIASQRFPWKPIGVFLLCTGAYAGCGAIDDWNAKVLLEHAPAPSPLTRWLEAERHSRGKLIVAARQPQTFVHLTPGVGYHWYHDRTSFADVCGMTSKLQVDYVLASGGTAFTGDRRFGGAFELVRNIGGAAVYRPRAHGPCARSAAPSPTRGR